MFAALHPIIVLPEVESPPPVALVSLFDNEILELVSSFIAVEFAIPNANALLLCKN